MNVPLSPAEEALIKAQLIKDLESLKGQMPEIRRQELIRKLKEE
jgi:hypothetical protein